MQLELFDGLPEQLGTDIIVRMVRPRNISEAFRRVKQNGGAPGIDGMTVEQLGRVLRDRLPVVSEELMRGTYQPQPVRRVEIPKPAGGTRKLGIPTAMDRLLQQALLQIVDPLFDPEFSEHSYGFRRGRGCHQAVMQAKRHIQDGYRWVVDMDLEKFFDRVHHDVLMDRVERKVKDKLALTLIRRYLQAGVLEGGLVSETPQGTPQGGPMSPLLSNVMLDDLDKELEKRGHRFCRYADDCNIYVKSRRAGDRVLNSLTNFLDRKLRLTVNTEKSAVDRPWTRQFLGFSFLNGRDSKIRMAPEREKRMKTKAKLLLRAGRGRKITRTLAELASKIRGWAGYFGLAEVKAAFERFDQWMKRRIRLLHWRQWKFPRTRAKELSRRGVDRAIAWKAAYRGVGPWRNAKAHHLHLAIPTQQLRLLGWTSILEEVQNLKRLK